MSYIYESRQELQRVNWPSKNETIHLTLVVIGVSLLIAAFLGALDFVLKYILGLMLA
ncbi:preprotein translocase subunit SecE [Candidatus Wolfebacteria bacterium RIFCSPLOWO2_01_FULL_38_11]|uniref:Protein translocase subunit SecE n=1 Tax=Candidatus Wolfebacteria bacterium RIFCSPLOWO2_01_FULL_38_11 TaxID=1802556 RepID=A0A1F8DPG3_9BACT|nr:MAG: preprotein translocase subunit SecE [Candidatus Wolfebacteria bacterium RIFCSPLOWO2_01_FULL_38_11]